MTIIDENTASLSSDGRSQPRSSIFLAAVLRTATEQAPAKVRNMSANGAMVESPLTLAAGMKVDLMRGALVSRGTVAWSSAGRCGVRFDSEVSVKEWLAAPTKVQQQRVDEIVALVKAGATDLGDAPEVPREARSNLQLVDDLGAVAKLMQDLEDDLASSVETLERHGMKLQNLDIAMQMVRAVANELTSDNGERQVSTARLDDLRIACSQALGTG